jgi:hypothetical protein
VSDKKHESVTGVAPNAPKAFIEMFTAAAAVSGTKLVYDVSKDAYIALKPSNPLSIIIEDSETVEYKVKDNDKDVIVRQHVIQAEIINLGQHAVYIGSFEIVDPPKTKVEVGASIKQKLSETNFNHSEKKVLSFNHWPLRLLSDRRIRVRVCMEHFDEARLKKKPFATIAINYLILGLAKTPKPHKFYAAIRI